MPPSSADSTPTGRYHVTRYGKSGHFAVYEEHEGPPDLLAWTVYKKGAEYVQRILEARDAVIAAQAEQIAQLTAAAPATPEPPSVHRPRFRERIRPDHDPQLGTVS